jgi:hypothetical protein
MKHVVMPSKDTERSAEISQKSTIGNYNNNSNNGTFFMSVDTKGS